MMREMNEKIHVFARSVRGKIEPIQFIFNNRRFLIRHIIHARQETIRNQVNFYFLVDLLPQGHCELLFDLKAGEWIILKGDLA